MKNHWGSLLVGALAAPGGLLERLGGVLETSWSRLGAAAGSDAGFDAAAAGSKLAWWLEASCSLSEASWGVLKAS